MLIFEAFSSWWLTQKTDCALTDAWNQWMRGCEQRVRVTPSDLKIDDLKIDYLKIDMLPRVP